MFFMLSYDPTSSKSYAFDRQAGFVSVTMDIEKPGNILYVCAVTLC